MVRELESYGLTSIKHGENDIYPMKLQDPYNALI
jgi:hypothetical protein